MKRLVNGVRLSGNTKTLLYLNDLWVEDHVFRALDPRIKSFFGAHLLFTQIERGHVRVYGAFDEENELGGVCFGVLSSERETFEGHIAFRRGYSASEGIWLCSEAMREDYLNDGITVTGIVGYIPVFNRAAILAAKRTGYRDYGVKNGLTVEHDGADWPCRELRLKFAWLESRALTAEPKERDQG